MDPLQQVVDLLHQVVDPCHQVVDEFASGCGPTLVDDCHVVVPALILCIKVWKMAGVQLYYFPRVECRVVHRYLILCGDHYRADSRI